MERPFQNRLRPVRLGLYLALCVVFVVTAAGVGEPGAVQPPKKRPSGEAFHPKVPAGKKATAITYYNDIGLKLGFPGDKPPEDLNAVLEYAGYKGLLATDVEKLDPKYFLDFEELKKKVSNPDDFKMAFKDKPIDKDEIVSVRFFAPKITDVAVEPDKIKFGWRKVVRFKTRTNSPAKGKNIGSMYMLFNFFEADLTKSPFEKNSINNQVMLVRDKQQGDTDPAYWLVFDSLEKRDIPTEDKPGLGKRITYLTATFDQRDPNLVENNQYHVPTACQVCHGDKRKTAKLNYMDTDHWLDRVQKHDDFAALHPDNQMKWQVLFDQDPQSLGVAGTFKAFRTLNEEVLKQNLEIDKDSYQVRAVEKWLDLHTMNLNREPLLSRALRPVKSTDLVWADKEGAPDKELLPLLNRYCYRCHSSVKFNVFDKQAIAEVKNGIIQRTQLDPNEGNMPLIMPQDRLLPEDLKKKLGNLAEKLPDL